MTTTRRDGIYVRSSNEATPVCDGCRRTVKEVFWVSADSWVDGRLDRGNVIGSFCADCRDACWSHCWRCGEVIPGARVCDLCGAEQLTNNV